MAGEQSTPPGAPGFLTGESGVLPGAYDHAPVALLRTSGPEHRYQAANRAYRDLVGRHDLLGLRPPEVLPERACAEQLELLDRVFGSGSAEHHHALRTTLDHIERFLDVTAAPYLDRDGAVAGVDLVLVDVTEPVRQRAEEQRRTQHLAHRARQHDAGARELLMQLQDALLPVDLPVLPRVDVAARYLLATDDTAAGGDWFDALVRDDGTVVLVVGDVVGHGLAAAAAMAQLRAVLHQRLLTGTLTEAVAAVDQYAGDASDTRAATICVVHLDPDTGDLAYCTAGHPAPVVLSPDGRSRFLEPSGSGPLATGGEVRVARELLAEGELVLLYTDGIIERPGTPPARSTLDLARTSLVALGNGGGRGHRDSRGPERVCQLVLERLVRISGYRDDIALLAAQRVPELPQVRIRLPADRKATRITRERLADWLDGLTVRALDELCVQHAVGELVANAVEHAYPPGTTGPVSVSAHVDRTGQLVVDVADQGHWQEPGLDASPHRGNGLAMVREFVDHLDLHRREHGTTASVRHRLARPAHLLRADAERPARLAETRFHVDDRQAAEGILRIGGAVDVRTADSLRHALLQASRGGTTGLVVDLGGVTLLASAGVQVLAEVAAQHVDEHAGLDLRAPMGSVAQHVLETVRIPYRLSRSDPRS